MTEKEKQAIKNCNLLLNGDITLHIIDDDGGTAYAGTVNKLYNKDLETVLKLLQTKQEEIEEYQRTLDIFDKRKYRKRYLEEERAKRPKLLYPDADEIYQRYYEQKAEIEKKDAQIQILMNKNKNLEKECQEYYDAMMDTISDNNNKNLMINLMAEQLTTPVHSKEWVIKYYKKKVEEC